MPARPALLTLVALGAAAHACDQEATPDAGRYRRVYAGELVGGYVRPGELVEATGYVAVRRGAVWLKTDLPSAAAALPVEVSRLPDETVRRLRERCTAENEPLTVGGCTAQVRGEVTPPASDGSPGLAADAIVVLGD